MTGGLLKFIACGLFATTVLSVQLGTLRAAEPKSRRVLSFAGISANSQRKAVIDSLPLRRLTPAAGELILSIAKSPTLYRRLPTQDIECDKDLFLFLTRNPEVMVGMWELMGITQVKIQRTGPYRLQADDGSGTTCQVDLIYGDQSLHIYYAEGMYDGRMSPKPIRGKGIFVVRSQYAKKQNQKTNVHGTLDCFVKFDSFGADLVARTLGGVIGKSADSNYVETAKFIQQVSSACERNPTAMMDLSDRLPQVIPATRKQFSDVIVTVARRSRSAANSPTTKPRTASQLSVRKR